MTIIHNSVIDRQLRKLNMNVLESAYAKLDTKWNYENSFNSFTRLYFVLEGGAVIRYFGHEVKLEAGNIYIIPAGLPFSCRCYDKMDKIYFHINILKPNNYDIFYGSNQCIVLENKQEIIEKLCESFKLNTLMAAVAIEEILWNVVAEGVSLSGVGSEELAEYSGEVKKTIRYINNNLRSGLGVAQIASDLFFSPSFIMSRFKKEVGVPIGRYINDRIMFEAEIKIRQTNMSVREVSDFFGFCDQFYFSRMFTKFYGISPREYRKRSML